jgi:hypothetical protein
VDEMIAPVLAAFPLQRRDVFLSWSRAASRKVATALGDVIRARLPAAAEVFLSPDIPPGANPQKEMLDRNLLVADVHVVVLTKESAKSPWVIWETAASWGRRKPVIPVFVDVQPEEIDGPLAQLAQGVHLGDPKDLGRGLREVLDAVGGDVDQPLTAEEFESVRRAAAA